MANGQVVFAAAEAFSSGRVLVGIGVGDGVGSVGVGRRYAKPAVVLPVSAFALGIPELPDGIEAAMKRVGAGEWLSGTIAGAKPVGAA